MKVIVWFSCGAASSVAAKLAIEKYGHDVVSVVYCDTSKNEHPDNARFMNDVSLWLNHRIETISSSRYANIEDVFQDRKYMAGIHGAPCTVELKKKPRFEYQKPGDIHCFGYTNEELTRIRNFRLTNHDLILDLVLVDANYSKADCFNVLRQAGVNLPVMYKLGYQNNNCLGCVKATSPHYWAMIRRDFPVEFESRATQSRQLNVRLCRFKGVRIFLDELPDIKEINLLPKRRESISCGPECSDEKVSP